VVRRRLGLIALGIVVVLLVGPFLVPVPPLKDTVPARQLADEDSRFVTALGMDVHYKEWGTGRRTIVLLHGFGASTFSWREVTGPLSEDARVIAYDRPAFGLTERPMPGEWHGGDYPGGSPYAPEAQADLVVALLDAWEVDRAVLVGHSAGGSIALLAALRHPERIEALVLVDAAVYAEGGPSALVYPLLATPQMRHLGPLIARTIGGTAGERILELSWHDPTRITPEIRVGYRAPLAIDDWDRALWELTVARSPQRLGERVAEVASPALVVTGAEDRVVPPADSARLAQEIAGARYLSIEACGHLPHEECPQEFLDAVSQFLGSLP
jgi:pimeloyl-ACP methyl ester carboxylesterase